MSEMTGNEIRLKEKNLEAALIEFYAGSARSLNKLVDRYDAAPYKTTEEKKYLAGLKDSISLFHERMTTCRLIARRGGVELPDVEVKHVGQRSREMWKNRKPVGEGTSDGTFVVE